MKAIIITIGDEILLGQILDTNSKYIAKRLADIGMEVVEMLTVPDKRDEIYEKVDYAMKESELVVVTGGLGPTKDDVTKKVLAEYFDSKIVYNEEAMGWLKELLKNRCLTLNKSNRSQAYQPDKCRLLRNFKGTACGMWFEKNGKSLISMPGVPFEMEHLMETYVIPDLKAKYPDLQLEYRMLKVYDITESMLSEHLENWENQLREGCQLAYLPSPGMIRLRVTAKGAAVNYLDEVYESLKQELKGMRYTEGDDALEKLVGRLLKSKGKTVATAESCTGGNIAHLLTTIPGSSAYFRGSVVAYANEIKTKVLGVPAEVIEKNGVVSEPVVLKMAEGVRNLMGTDYAVSTSGVAGPDGGTDEIPMGTVWIGVATPEGSFAKRYVFSFTRERNIAKAASKALELLSIELM